MAMASWAKQHLVEIAKRIRAGFGVSFIQITMRLRAAVGLICRSKTPWLMLAPETDNSSSFLSLSEEGKVHRVILPKAKGKACYSSKGWLITFDKDGNVTLLHPFKKYQIQLPNIRKIPNWKRDWHSFRDPYPLFIHKCVLSSNPLLSLDYTLMIIYGSPRKMAYCKPGFKSWIAVDTGLRGTVYDVTYFQGNFYSIHDEAGGLKACHIASDNTNTIEQLGQCPTSKRVKLLVKQYYIVESGGALLVIARRGKTLWRKYSTLRFRIWKVNLSTGKWTVIKSLGNRALFLGSNSSFSVEASTFGCKPNCIYYTEDNFEDYFVCVERGKDMAIYNLQDRRIEPHTHFDRRSNCRINPRPMWVEQGFD